MYELKQTLLAFGYSGPCENLNLLQWAIRAGASSQFFNDLVCWLELQLDLIPTTQQVRDNINRLFSMLRHSVLMKPSYGSDLAINPKVFRLQTLKVLTMQLKLRQPSERMQYVGENFQAKQESGVHTFDGVFKHGYKSKSGAPLAVCYIHAYINKYIHIIMLDL